MSWSALEAAAPDIARLGRARLERTGMGLLGTLRSDGSPRISPIGIAFAEGELLVGVMPRSAKARDLRRDPRCALQSVVSNPEGGDPELKLYGHLVASTIEADWWAGRLDAADVYALAVEEAVYIEWELEQSRMRVRRWTAGGDATLAEHAYP